MENSKPSDMLVKLELMTHKARQEVLEEYVDDRVARRLITRALNSPTFLPLLELELNGCTSFRCARILIGEELARPATFKARAKGFRGKQCEYISVTTLGQMTLFEEQEGLQDNRWLELLRHSILDYICIDEGDGICLVREFLETALELPDPEILSRCVLPTSGERQFSDSSVLRNPISEKQRAECSHWWSTGDAGPRSCRVIDLSDYDASDI